MSKKILLAQSVEELKFILSNIKKMDTVCVPLNLSTQLYCIINKINFYNQINYITNDFHRIDFDWHCCLNPNIERLFT